MDQEIAHWNKVFEMAVLVYRIWGINHLRAGWVMTVGKCTANVLHLTERTLLLVVGWQGASVCFAYLS